MLCHYGVVDWHMWCSYVCPPAVVVAVLRPSRFLIIDSAQCGCAIFLDYSVVCVCVLCVCVIVLLLASTTLGYLFFCYS